LAAGRSPRPAPGAPHAGQEADLEEVLAGLGPIRVAERGGSPLTPPRKEGSQYMNP
jgi:hypothetical protein